MMFFIELPADSNGNTAMPPAILEGEIVQGGSPGTEGFSNPDRKVLIITGPPGYKHRHMYVDSWGGFAEVEGPARLLTIQEHRAIIQGGQYGQQYR